MDLNNKNIVISRTDSIGDVILTLPLCAWLKKNNPDVNIIFLGKGYTKPIIEACQSVDVVADWNDFSLLSKEERVKAFKAFKAHAILHVFPNKEIATLAKKAEIPVRVGTSHRLYHLWTCNHRLNFTRRKSNLHEAQLNHELLRPFGLDRLPELKALERTTEGFRAKTVDLPKEFSGLTNVTILHPKSQGSAKEWPIEKYMELATQLVSDGKTVIFTGTEEEGAKFRSQIPKLKSIIDSTGKLSLEQLMVLIQNASNIVACSTGPLHIAASLGVNTVGLYVPRRPMHPGRWGAIGKRVNTLVFDENCTNCANQKDCSCITEIKVERILKSLI